MFTLLSYTYMHLLVLLPYIAYVRVIRYCVHLLVDGYAACQTTHSRNHTKFTRLSELTPSAFSTSTGSLPNSAQACG